MLLSLSVDRSTSVGLGTRPGYTFCIYYKNLCFIYRKILKDFGPIIPSCAQYLERNSPRDFPISHVMENYNIIYKTVTTKQQSKKAAPKSYDRRVGSRKNDEAAHIPAGSICLLSSPHSNIKCAENCLLCQRGWRWAVAKIFHPSLTTKTSNLQLPISGVVHIGQSGTLLSMGAHGSLASWRTTDTG